MAARATYLDDILARHRGEAARDDRDLASLVETARACGPARGFAASAPSARSVGHCRGEAPVAVEGSARGADLDPAAPGQDLRRRAAPLASRCSPTGVLRRVSDRPHQGSRRDGAAGAAQGLHGRRPRRLRRPLDGRRRGAAHRGRPLGRRARATSTRSPREVGLDALVEVHDEPELERALAVGATFVGVNQRDLVTFEVDHARGRAHGRARSPPTW